MTAEHKTAAAPTEFDIAIIGMGPVGAAAALFLARAGLTVAVIERDAEVYKLPRAVALDGEIVRGFQRLGLGDRVASLLQPIRPGGRIGFGNSRREWLFNQAPPPSAAMAGRPSTCSTNPSWKAISGKPR